MNTSRKTNQVFFCSMVLCSMVLASLLALLAFTPAFAATTPRTVVPNVSCNFSGAQMISQSNQTHGNETRHVQLWYSPASRCVWAAETNGQPGDQVWVFNRDTGAERLTVLGGHSGDTAEINDAGTQSHACMLPLYSNGTNGPTTCTPYF
ncbi:MAG TPA: hypothetical protein VFN35_08425 [Ktedonobacteraceae bacterium]|nr:hypothetical protein [Ktedonobacteraceae bacterium]